MIVELDDGRELSIPLGWYPRLAHATASERNRWELNASGDAIHWPGVDEDLSVQSMIEGQRSRESARSFERWLRSRENPRKD
jgi:hypothetical protein